MAGTHPIGDRGEPSRSREVHVAHIPPGASNGWIKVEMLEGLFRRLSRDSAIPRILCGDFNTPRAEKPDGRVVTWAEVENARGEVRLRPSRGPRWDAGERNVLLGLASFDLPDVFRLLHGYGVDAFSWFCTNRGRRVGRRFDHVFASVRLNAAECRYLHEWREAGLSDHSPLAARFE